MATIKADKNIFYAWGFYAHAVRNDSSLSKKEIEAWLETRPYMQQIKEKMGKGYCYFWKVHAAKSIFDKLTRLLEGGK